MAPELSVSASSSNSQRETRMATSLRVRLAHTVFATWFISWLVSLGFLCVATKYQAVSTALITNAAREALGEEPLDRQLELLESARATNNSVALIALVSLSCFMRSFKLSYMQCVLVGIALLVTVLVSWLLQPPTLPLGEHQAVMCATPDRPSDPPLSRLRTPHALAPRRHPFLSRPSRVRVSESSLPASSPPRWTNLVWVLVAMLTEIGLVRAGEKVRRRLFHLQRLMERSNMHLLQENEMLQAGSIRVPGDDTLDLESPVQKVLALLRRMLQDPSLTEWQGSIERAIHKLSRAKLHDLFLPSTMALPSAAQLAPGEHAETEMVEQILGELGHHDDQDELTHRSMHVPTPRDHTLDDGTLVEDRRKNVLKEAMKSRFGKARLGLLAGLRTQAGLGSLGGGKKSESADSPSRPPAMHRDESFSPSREISDERLTLIADSMPVWGCGEATIFGLDQACGPDLLFLMLENAFRAFDLFEFFSIDAEKLHQLSSAIISGYNNHPYHNHIHSCDVMQGTYWMLRQRMPALSVQAQAATQAGEHALSWAFGADTPKSGKGGDTVEQEVWQCMPRYAVLAALIGAAMHDIGHDGHNNAFHVATGSDLAFLYNDKSCLESLHASKGLALLKDGKNDILEHVPQDQRRKFRTLVIDMIMATDLAHHFEHLSQIQTKMAEGEGLQLCGEKSDLALFLGNVLHAADLGSTAHPPVVYFNWMQRVFKEFFHQGQLEHELGIPVTPFMDRPTASIPKAQLGFLKYLCLPLYNAIVVVIPNLSVAQKCMEDNIAMLQQLEDGKVDTETIMSASRLQDLLPDYTGGPPLENMEC
jgi:cGMP-inhibited 3',5'-cyclic phosphodiesterase A